jgi:hypothetical protein
MRKISLALGLAASAMLAFPAATLAEHARPFAATPTQGLFAP